MYEKYAYFPNQTRRALARSTSRSTELQISVTATHSLSIFTFECELASDLTAPTFRCAENIKGNSFPSSPNAPESQRKTERAGADVIIARLVQLGDLVELGGELGRELGNFGKLDELASTAGQAVAAGQPAVPSCAS